MTLHIVDCSRHQVERSNPLDLARARTAGIGAVNLQLDRGKETDVLPPWVSIYAERARSLGMQVSTYRWLDARISGAESAQRAYDRIRSLGLEAAPHTVDCEDNATEKHLRDYVDSMQDLLGRHIFIYSGHWWLQPKGWQVASLSPYLWAAPSGGYIGLYPGDNAPDWTVEYGGYSALSAMQYAVKALPGTGNCSLSAVRDPAVWAALSGKEASVPTYAQLQAEPWYNQELVTPEYANLHTRLRAALGLPAVNVGSKGDNQHLNGGHRSQAWIENSRYCTNRTYATEPGLTAEEKRWLSASDITAKSRAHMLTISRNIDRATRSGQLEEVVEWFGNTDDDTRVDGWNNILNTVATSDSSHLWHLHMRLKRKVLRDAAVMDRVFNAIVYGTVTEGSSDMPLSAADIEAISLAVWTRDLQDDVDGVVKVETAYNMLKRAADAAQAVQDRPSVLTLTEADRDAIVEDLRAELGDQAADAVADKLAARLQS